MPINSKFLLLPFLLLIAGGVTIAIFFMGMLSPNAIFEQCEAEVIQRENLQMSIREEFGYGGAIHAFKNYLLRNDEQYAEAFIRASWSIQQSTADYRTLGNLAAVESSVLNIIDETVETYRQQFDKIERMVVEGFTPKQIDAMVRVDDRPALKALVSLKEHYQRIRSESKVTLEKSIQQSIAYGVSSLSITVIVALLLALQIRGNQKRQKTFEQQLQREKAYNRKVIDSLGEGLYGVDTESRLTFLNPAAERMLGWKESELLGKQVHDIIHYQHPDGSHFPAEECPLLEVLQSGATYQSDDDVFMHRDGTNFNVEYISTPLYENGEIVGSVMGFMDISERKAMSNRIHKLAFFDELTGLPNRHFLSEFAERDLLLTERYELGFALLYIDLDNFQIINDTHGHMSGDALLKQVAERLKQTAEGEDIIARPGGDEFIMLLFDPSHWVDPTVGCSLPVAEAAEERANRIIEALKKPFILHNSEIYISASVGISLYPVDGEKCTTLLTHADSAAAHVKEMGRKNYAFYSEEISKKREKYHILETALHQALEQEEFVLYYQPIMDLSSNGIVGAEALIRWQSTDHGLVSPDDFIPVAEKTGLILPIGEWVLSEACRQAVEWRQHGFELRVAVNLSVREFMSGELVPRLKETLKRESCPVGYIELEVTESVSALDETAMLDKLEEVSRLGFKISLDDFGTGYSSLSRLKRLPVDTMKIDKSFIQDVINDKQDQSIVIASMKMAQGLGKGILAEGIEDGEQLAFLRENSCQLGQGYHFSRPLPAAEFEQLLLNRHERG